MIFRSWGTTERRVRERYDVSTQALARTSVSHTRTRTRSTRTSLTRTCTREALHEGFLIRPHVLPRKLTRYIFENNSTQGNLGGCLATEDRFAILRTLVPPIASCILYKISHVYLTHTHTNTTSRQSWRAHTSHTHTHTHTHTHCTGLVFTSTGTRTPHSHTTHTHTHATRVMGNMEQHDTQQQQRHAYLPPTHTRTW